MTNYFANCTTLEELKKEYYSLVKKNHPDNGGNVETMQAINAEYDIVFEKVKDIHKTKEGNSFTKETSETSEDFKKAIDELLKFKVVIEIIGCFVWVSGDTKPAKDVLKHLGFKWHKVKQVWFKSPEGYKRYGKTEYTMDQIRSMYRNNGTIYGGTTETASNVALMA